MTAQRSATRRSDRVLWGLALLWLAWMTVPYGLVAWWGRRQGLVFVGFLHNPYDNFTYLAKMRQGWEGAWVYRLAFTPQPGPGAPLFLFYLALGHLARLLNLRLLTVYHAARLLTGALLWWSLWRAVRAWFAGRWARRFGLTLVLFGSGLGWLLFPFRPEKVPPDMGIPEAFPYLAVLSNAHFPLALALSIILVLWPWSGAILWRSRLLWAGLAALLGVVYPFGVAVVLSALVLGGLPLWWWQRLSARLTAATRARSWPAVWERALWVGLGGLPYPVYAWAVTHLDPQLAAWNAQNITPSPPWWVMTLALSPALPLALFMAWEHWGQGRLPAQHESPAWGLALGSLALSQVPIALQRRFFAAAYPPTALMVTARLASLPARPRRHLSLAVLALSLPSTLLLLMGFFFLAAQGSPVLYLTPDEDAALTWVRDHTPAAAVFLSSPEMGARLAALTGRRVVAGHPMETPHFAMARERIRTVLCAPVDEPAKKDAWQATGAHYLWVGPRERAFCAEQGLHLPAGLRLLYHKGEVRVYEGWEE